jgi:hypothetical protein
MFLLSGLEIINNIFPQVHMLLLILPMLSGLSSNHGLKFFKTVATAALMH